MSDPFDRKLGGWTVDFGPSLSVAHDHLSKVENLRSKRFSLPYNLVTIEVCGAEPTS